MFKNIYMEKLLDYTKKVSFDPSEIPVGALIVHDNQILAINHNRCIELNDPSAHAEVLVIKQACQIFKNYRLKNCDLYCTLEPCPMCMELIRNARIRRLYFGAYRSFTKDINYANSFNNIYGGIHEEQASQLLREFFTNKR